MCGEFVRASSGPVTQAGVPGAPANGSPQSAPPPVPGTGAHQQSASQQTTVGGGAARSRVSWGSVVGGIVIVISVGMLIFLAVVVYVFIQFMRAVSCADCTDSLGPVGTLDLGMAPLGFMMISSSLRGVLQRD